MRKRHVGENATADNVYKAGPFRRHLFHSLFFYYDVSLRHERVSLRMNCCRRPSARNENKLSLEMKYHKLVILDDW